MRPMKRRAFTLIEMLVVIAIIAILMAILTPAISKVREYGRAARCASNLRQLQIATLNYSTDNGCLPLALSFWAQEVDGSGSTYWKHYAGWVGFYQYPDGDVKVQAGNPGGSYDWRGNPGIGTITNGCLWGYVKEKNVYLCPTFQLRTVCGVNDAMRSYSMNTNVSWARLGTYQASSIILYGDDRNITSSPYDGGFGTNATDLGQWHSGASGGGSKGFVVYGDGRVCKP